MKRPIFKIENLVCSYSMNPEDAVLRVKDLVIEKGELIFLLGASGSGKSTLLETLGLMNNTLAEGSIQFMSPDAGMVRYEDIWYGQHNASLADVRKKYFSFIFQNTNLMENFTAYENICLSPMIQQGITQNQALDDATILMNKVNLPIEQVGLDTLSVNLSGGQRQRVAFVRALVSKYTVLFCDEPTGNLDEQNANELMRMLREAISDDASVIVVSHDINLALAHATTIICFSRDEESKCSEIRSNDIFRSQDWQHKSGIELEQFKSRILRYYRATDDKLVGRLAAPVDKALSDDRKTFRRLFFRKEGIALAGKFKLNYLLLGLLFVLTFLAIGFANGSLDYLDKKMNNAFVNWLTVSIPWSRSDVDEVLRELNQDDIKKKYNIIAASGYSEQPVSYFNKTENKFLRTKCRSFQPGKDQLLKDILEPHNRVIGDSAFSGIKDFGLIVTTRFMDDFGYDLNDPFIIMEHEIMDTITNEWIHIPVPVPVRAVVKEIPGKIQVAFTDFYRNAYNQLTDNPFDITKVRKMNFMFTGSQEMAEECASKMKLFFQSDVSWRKYDPDVQKPIVHQASYAEGFDIIITFWPEPESFIEAADIARQLRESDFMKPYTDMIRLQYDFGTFSGDTEVRKDFSMVSINFSSLDMVREFSKYMLTRFNEEGDRSLIEVDIGRVKEKENLNFLSKIATVISWLVILFAAMSASLFVFNMLRSHLNKVKMNIGTFLAFGLSNSISRQIYFLIILRFVLIALLLGCLTAFGIGYLLNLLFHKVLVIEEGFNYFVLMHKLSYLTLVIIVTTVVIVSWFTIRKILNKTPGDLIYNR